MRLKDIFWIIDTKNSRALITKWAEKAGKNSTALISYVEGVYPETSDQLAIAYWLCNYKELREPIIKQALYICKQKKLDPLKQDPKELVEKNPDIKPKDKPINPDEYLSDRKEDGEGNVTFAAEDDDRETIRQIINTHYGIDANPWCLLVANDEGQLTGSSKEMWEHYSAYPKRIAFRNGKLLAFSAGTNEKMREWWDRFDRSFPFIPYDGKTWTGSDGETYEIRKGNVFKHKGSETSRLSTTYSENIEETYSDVKIDTRQHILTDRFGTYLYEEKDGKYVVTNGRQDYTHRIVSFTMNKDLELDGEYVERDARSGKILIVKHYTNGRLNGSYETYQYGDLYERKTYKNDNLEGPYEKYHDNGNVREKGTYKNDKLNGVVEYFFEEGQLSDRITFKDGVKDGPYESYHSNGQLNEKGSFENDKEAGIYERYFENGQLKTKCSIKNSSMDGPYESYYSNGQLNVKCTYKDDAYVGPYERYFENGQLRMKCTYNENSELEGLCETYGEDGRLIRKEAYENGFREGLSESYYPNGQLKVRCIYKEDAVLNGPYEKYTEDGRLVQKEVYKDGVLVG